jgi:hypothetical protein
MFCAVTRNIGKLMHVLLRDHTTQRFHAKLWIELVYFVIAVFYWRNDEAYLFSAFTNVVRTPGI